MRRAQFSQLPNRIAAQPYPLSSSGAASHATALLANVQAAGAPLGCVEAAHNWFASGCRWGAHLGNGSQLAAALGEYTAGWPTGGVASERCFAQREEERRGVSRVVAGREARGGGLGVF